MKTEKGLGKGTFLISDGNLCGWYTIFVSPYGFATGGRFYAYQPYTVTTIKALTRTLIVCLNVIV